MIPLHDDNPTTLAPVVTIALIAACVVAFLVQLGSGEGNQRLVFSLGVIPATLLGHARLSPDLYLVPPVVTLFSSMFLHGGWLHLGGNMLYLWIFGNNVEDSMGHVRFLVFYLLCGLGAALAQALPAPTSTVPMIGASGAISGVLGAYLLLYPRARVLVVVPLGFFTRLVRLPALWVLGFWFAMQLLSEVLAPAGGAGVAFRAHLGGFLCGMALIPVFRNRRFRLYNPLARR